MTFIILKAQRERSPNSYVQINPEQSCIKSPKPPTAADNLPQLRSLVMRKPHRLMMGSEDFQ